jgi:membrane protein required for colicin V production
VSGVNAVDIILIGLLSLCGVRGFVRGLFRETMGLAGFVLGAAAAVWYWRPVAALLTRYLGLGPVLGQVGAALAIFIAVNVTTHVGALLLDRVAKTIFLSGATRVAGAVVGASKGAVVAGFLLLFLRSSALMPEVTDAIGTSRLGRPLADVAAHLLRVGSEAMGSPAADDAA